MEEAVPTSHVKPIEPAAAAGEARRADAPVSIILELNVGHPGGLRGVRDALFRLFEEHAKDPVSLTAMPGDVVDPGTPPGLRRLAPRLYQCVLTRPALAELMKANAAEASRRGGSAVIFKAWPDYQLEAQIDRSAPTVKADAARRSYAATGKRIVWAVMDTGIDATHPHFSALPLAKRDEMRRAKDPDGTVRGKSPTFGRHRDFTGMIDPTTPADPPSPLTDESGHGTHVAGIIAGACPDGGTPHVATADEPLDDGGRYVPRQPDPTQLRGMAPDCALVSLKVMQVGDDGLAHTSAATLIRAIDYIQNEVNVGRGPLQIHGVNISIGCVWDAEVYAAGQSPLCQAIDQLVASGVVVVISAGNSGQQATRSGDLAAVLGSITEPGHAADCITVGSTHRDSPHAFGITHTSSKGPTLDGRMKPDVVAPGEWITSAATGLLRVSAGLDRMARGTKDPKLTYAEDSGTSMAAPHVSGVIAAFLSARPEFIGRPQHVKRLLCENAMDLRRERYAQGHGLVDLMRVLSNS